MQVSKIQAAKAQLITAIDLFFREADPVSIHTLACAAYEILTAAAKSTPIRPLLTGSMIDIIKEEHKERVLKALKEPQNFFKHGKRDINASLNFEPEGTAFFLYDAITLYIKITNETSPSPHMKAYLTWFFTTYSFIFKKLPISHEEIAIIKSNKKEYFLKLICRLEQRDAKS